MTFTTRRPAAWLTALLALTSLPAQELLAVDYSGNAYGVSPTGQRRDLGATGLTDCNAMARLGSQLFVAARSAGRHCLATLDPITARATVLFPQLGVDVRALELNPVFSTAGNRTLFGVVNTRTNVDDLVTIDVGTGQVATIGSTGRSGIQALAHHGNTLYGWDVVAGLVRIDPSTGVATDPFPAVGTSGVSVQFLCVDHAFSLVGGNSSLYRIDPQTGLPSLIGSLGGFVDLRGADRHLGRLSSYGTGCPQGVGGTFMSAGSDAMPGSRFMFASLGHQPGRNGVMLIGFTQVALGMVGTPCLQLTSGDFSVPFTSSSSGMVKDTLALPGTFGTVLHLQLVMLENVPGGVVTTNAFKVEMPN